MKTINILVNDETFALIQQSTNKKLPGRVWLEENGDKKQLYFKHYHLTAEPRTRVLHQAPFGCLSDNARNVKLSLTVSKKIGLHRVADLLLSNAIESTDALHLMADSEIVNNETTKQNVKI